MQYDFTGVSFDLELLRSELKSLQATTDRHIGYFNRKIRPEEEEDDEEWYPPTPPVYDVAEKGKNRRSHFWRRAAIDLLSCCLVGPFFTKKEKIFRNDQRWKTFCQGTLTEGEGSVQLTTFLR